MSNADRSKSTTGGQGAATAVARELGDPNLKSVLEKADKAQQSRIEDLRRRYLQGTYHVDAEAMSASIVDKHLNK